MQVRIKGYTFSLSAPYSEGQPLSEGEAKALNDLRAENIQNNFRGFVNEQVARLGSGGLIPQSILSALQLQLDNYDKSYSFNARPGRNRTGDIEREALAIAAGRVKQQADPAMSKEALDGIIIEYSKLPAVIEEARSRVEASRSALAGGMDSL